MLPLNGIRIIDLSRALAGPYCTALLADLGAEIIKVESITGGDSSRSWPPFQGDHSLYFDSANRNKKSIALDLYSEAGREVLSRLLSEAEALVENFKPGTLAKMGFSAEVLKTINPRLITTSINGYGDHGPLRQRAGLDQVVQAISGLTSVTGSSAENTYRVGVPIVDISSGMIAAVGLAAALLGRERGVEVERVSTSLFETALGLAVFQGQRALSLAEVPEPPGNDHPTISPYGVFRSGTEALVIAVGTEQQWSRFCVELGQPGLAQDERFSTGRDRTANRAELNDIITTLLAEQPASYWIDRLSAAGIPCGPINNYLQAVESEQAAALGMVQQVSRADGSELRLLRGPLSIDSVPVSITAAPPALGEQTRQILAAAGYQQEQVADLLRAGVAGATEQLERAERIEQALTHQGGAKW
ncbi:CaiB/BaiF CoA transferase family protein [Psychromicrobium lacuslunae]|uniref:CaiB/BaiF CoA transferase family protein n=1 Tax=Psychromicrobium lacuslunae TaxID=1618207 RepID=UPI0009E4860B|nr:CaiB/BaiF CoA-transferase family protein [Psychromicrobium lacuslunae]